jgi:hypothetical protein
MVPTSPLETSWTSLLASSTSAHLSLALKVLPVIIPFTPGEDMSSLSAGDIAATTIAGGIAVTAATRLSTRDPNTGAYSVNIQPPAGGFQENSGASGTYPATVYGCVLVETPYTIPDNIIGSKAFTTPQVLTAGGQLLEYGEIAFSFNVGAWF